jgi:hypothetical protein
VGIGETLQTGEAILLIAKGRYLGCEIIINSGRELISFKVDL